MSMLYSLCCCVRVVLLYPVPLCCALFRLVWRLSSLSSCSTTRDLPVHVVAVFDEFLGPKGQRLTEFSLWHVAASAMCLLLCAALVCHAGHACSGTDPTERTLADSCADFISSGPPA